MKRYDYRCPKCGEGYEGVHHAESPCPNCGETGIRRFTSKPLYHPTKSDK